MQQIGSVMGVTGGVMLISYVEIVVNRPKTRDPGWFCYSHSYSLDFIIQLIYCIIYSLHKRTFSNLWYCSTLLFSNVGSFRRSTPRWHQSKAHQSGPVLVGFKWDLPRYFKTKIIHIQLNKTYFIVYLVLSLIGPLINIFTSTVDTTTTSANIGTSILIICLGRNYKFLKLKKNVL